MPNGLDQVYRAQTAGWARIQAKLTRALKSHREA